MARICGGLNDIWCLENGVDSATITGPSATPDLGPERVRDPRIGVAWRPPVDGGEITMSFNPAIPLDVFSVHGITDPTVPMELAIGTGPGLSDVRTGPWMPIIDPNVKQATWINARDLGADPVPVVAEIVLTVLGDSDIGRIWAGPSHWEPCIGHSYGSDEGFIDLSTVNRSVRSGAVFSDFAVVQRTAKVEYQMIDPDEWSNQVFQLSKVAGTARQLLFIPDFAVYPPERHTILGYQEALNPIVAQGFQKFQKSFQMREAG